MCGYQQLINFLENTLIPTKGFRKLGKNSFIYEDNKDKIVVYVNTASLIIIHDGEEVISNFSVLPIASDEPSFYYQTIISRFLDGKR